MFTRSQRPIMRIEPQRRAAEAKRFAAWATSGPRKPRPGETREARALILALFASPVWIPLMFAVGLAIGAMHETQGSPVKITATHSLRGAYLSNVNADEGTNK